MSGKKWPCFYSQPFLVISRCFALIVGSTSSWGARSAPILLVYIIIEHLFKRSDRLGSRLARRIGPDRKWSGHFGVLSADVYFLFHFLFYFSENWKKRISANQISPFEIKRLSIGYQPIKSQQELTRDHRLAVGIIRIVLRVGDTDL